ncbi:hypothetical protein BGW80DRAFT_489209 [Lactifluus volemus]|nr:hypothetical protein BGW80DRAFT_489209 [Lactifluus volemus]
MAMTTISIIMTCETVSFSGPSPFPERRCGIKPLPMGTPELSVQTSQHAEPLRAHKYPIPKDKHHGLQIKMYGNFGNDIPKTADVLNFVGILTKEPLHADPDESMVVPTLHVLFTREHRLDILSAPKDPIQSQVREELLTWIADEALGGDHDAAEWVLLACVARVQSRTRSLNPPSLTLAHFPPSTSTPPALPSLSHVLALLLPLHVTLPFPLTCSIPYPSYPKA